MHDALPIVYTIIHRLLHWGGGGGGALLCLEIIGGAKVPPAPLVPTPLYNMPWCYHAVMRILCSTLSLSLIYIYIYILLYIRLNGSVLYSILILVTPRHYIAIIILTVFHVP